MDAALAQPDPANREDRAAQRTDGATEMIRPLPGAALMLRRKARMGVIRLAALWLPFLASQRMWEPIGARIIVTDYAMIGGTA